MSKKYEFYKNPLLLSDGLKMEQLYVVQIKSGSNDGEFLVKYNKGYTTKETISLQNLYHSKTVAEREAKSYVRECHQAQLDSMNEKDYLREGGGGAGLLAYLKGLALRGTTYEVITFNLVREVEEK